MLVPFFTLTSTPPTIGATFTRTDGVFRIVNVEEVHGVHFLGRDCHWKWTVRAARI